LAVVRDVALARPHSALVDGGVQLTVEGDEHAHRPWHLQLRLIDSGTRRIAQAESLLTEGFDKRRLGLDVDVDVFSA